jgi:hypothetical protein
MMDPITYAMKVQQAAFIGACCAAGVAAANFSRMLKGEQSLMFLPAHRRASEQHQPAAYIPRGASWADHYGKRSHDVDVEHMR